MIYSVGQSNIHVDNGWSKFWLFFKIIVFALSDIDFMKSHKHNIYLFIFRRWMDDKFCFVLNLLKENIKEICHYVTLWYLSPLRENIYFIYFVYTSIFTQLENNSYLTSTSTATWTRYSTREAYRLSYLKGCKSYHNSECELIFGKAPKSNPTS